MKNEEKLFGDAFDEVERSDPDTVATWAIVVVIVGCVVAVAAWGFA